MVSDGIKAARIQAQCSPLINSTWPGLPGECAVRGPARHGLAEPAPRRPPSGPPRRSAAPAVRPPRAALTWSASRWIVAAHAGPVARVTTEPDARRALGIGCGRLRRQLTGTEVTDVWPGPRGSA
jgi:hypothetical protein